MKKQNIAIIAVVALVLAVSVGYALFSQTLTIAGTAKASGSFDVQFTEIGDIKSDGYIDTNAADGDDASAVKSRIAKIEDNGHKLTITVDRLSYPGAYVTIPVTVQNKGSIPVKLKEITQNGLTLDNRAIKVTYDGPAASDTLINKNETQSMTIKVEWDSTINGTDNSVDESVEFSITLDYEQVTAATTGA